MLYVSGVSKHLFYLLSELSKDEAYNIILVCPGGDFIDEFKKLKITVIEIEEISHQKRSYLNFLKSVLSIYSIVKKNKIEIIHSHTHYSANIAWWVSKITKCITIQTIHGVIPSGGRFPHFIADYFIIVNKNSIKHLMSNRKKKERIFFVNLGIPIPEKHLKDNSEIKILFASRLVPEKGGDIYLDAIALAKDKLIVKNSFAMAGEGVSENELRKQITDLKIQVSFLGKVENIYDYLKDSHIFIFTSRYQLEGFPLTIVEAALNGNLIITSDFASLKEIFQEDIDCLVFHNNDSIQLSEKIILAVNNYKDYSEMIVQGIEKAKNNFSISKMLYELKQVYQNVT
ncbi:MAG: glycosyltransferase family 4 protein [Ignavibacteriaceae bacterium]|nr:glycosyltransferase family 4 protein [Ignavibacteriaceae bacterium]